MVLKRIFWAALGSLGVSALLTGPASANIPPPDSLVDLAKCIAANTPAPRGARDAMAPPGALITTVATTDAADRDVDLAALFSAMNCTFDATEMEGDPPMPAYTGFLDINLAQRMMSAADQFGALDPDGDDYADDLAELQAEFAGPIFDMILAEVNARRTTDTAIDKFDEAKVDFLLPTRPQKMADGSGVVDGDGNPVLEDTGAERARYLALTYELEDDTTTSGVDESDPDDIEFRLLSGHTYTTTTVGDKEYVTGLTVTDSGTVADSEHDITETTTLGSLVTLRQTAEVDRNRAQALLDAEGTAGGIPLTNRERDHLEDVVAFRNVEIGLLNGAIGDIETTTENREMVREYRTALSGIESLESAAKRAADTQKTRNAAVRDTLIDPSDQLATLVALAKADLADAEDRELTGSALKVYTDRLANAEKAQANYNDATADAENPASDLLDSLLADDDTGQALLNAVSANHGTAQMALDGISDAVDSVESLTGADGRVTTIESEIGLDADGNGTVTLPDGTTGSRVDDIEAKLVLKKMYIDNLGEHIGVNPVTGMGTGENGMSRIDMNQHRSMTNAGDIEAQGTRITANEGAIRMNSGAIADNTNLIGSNSTAIRGNTDMIGELSESLEVVRAGVAASMALAGMPSINGRGVAIGVGSFDGESAFAIGFQIQSESTSFKVGVTSGGGATGASAGVGFQF